MEAYVVVDIETTGGHPVNNEIIEIGAVYVENGKVKDSFNQLVRPNEEFQNILLALQVLQMKWWQMHHQSKL